MKKVPAPEGGFTGTVYRVLYSRSWAVASAEEWYRCIATTCVVFIGWLLCRIVDTLANYMNTDTLVEELKRMGEELDQLKTNFFSKF
jgi:hypothetical protein